MRNEAFLEAARHGAVAAGQLSQFSPLNTALLTVAIGILGLILKHQLANRKLTVETNGEVRREFIEEMERVRGEVRELRDENRGLRDDIRHRDDKIDKMSHEIRGLHDMINGMRRENLAGHLSAGRIIAEHVPHSAQIDAALKSLGEIEGDSKP